MIPDPLTFAEALLYCEQGEMAGSGEACCVEHGVYGWPCEEAVRVAALIEARGREIRADEPCPTCRQVRAIRTRRARLRAVAS